MEDPFGRVNSAALRQIAEELGRIAELLKAIDSKLDAIAFPKLEGSKR